ncbi:MAG: hypothetical protein KatS3mg132_892 [Limisphaera sp.]|nr:MAG: hypothetical protein KatS3mg132_892 [Limisphaera sp.]
MCQEFWDRFYFVSYQFGPEFASGLSSVEIDAPRWAMDNLEPIPKRSL